jgi:predicted ArsR family transcriptional regulator
MDRKPEVLAFLKARGEASLGAVAEHLGVTKQGALRHLEALRDAGMVSVTPSSHPGPGRPEHRYHLTEAADELFPHGHRELAVELVAFMESRQLESFFRARAARLEAEYAQRLAGLDFESRVRELARVAAEHGHMTEVIEQNGKLQLRHCNCPIQDIAARTAYPCQQEKEMYRRLLGAEVERSTWLGQGDSSCTYDVGKHTDRTVQSTVQGEVNG